jgi:hypothetical protein
MATNKPDAAVAEHDAAADNAAPLPSFEERNHPADGVDLVAETRRIRWTLNGPLETAITISRDVYFDSDEGTEPYYLGNDDNEEPKWHAFSQLPLTEPKVSSLRLCVDPLDHWDYHWMEKHDQHLFLDEKRAGNVPDDEVLFGPLPPEAADKDGYLDPGDEHMLVCCREKRPLGKEVKVVIKPAAGEGRGFVTIHDFISTVHPYLMARRDEVLEAMSENPGRIGTPFGSETWLFVIWYSARYVDVLDEADWMRTRRRRPGPGKKSTRKEMERRMMDIIFGRNQTGAS